MSMSVCVSVRLHNSKTARPNFTIFCACCLWPWLGSPLTALRYATYFRFSGWRHIFKLWDQWTRITHDVRNTEKFVMVLVERQDNYRPCLDEFIRLRHWGRSLLSTIALLLSAISPFNSFRAWFYFAAQILLPTPSGGVYTNIGVFTTPSLIIHNSHLIFC